MITTTYNGEPVTLLLDRPNWAGGCELTHTLGSGIEQALTGIESRRPLHAVMRHKLTASWLLSNEAALAWQEGSILLDDGMLAVPLPCDTLPAGLWHLRLFSAGVNVVWNEGGSFMLFGRNEPVPAGYTWAAPLLCGKPDTMPGVTAVTPETCEFSLTLIENSAEACAVTPRDAGGAGHDWPEALDQNWKEAPSEQVRNLVEDTTVGAGREAGIEGVEAAPWRTMSFEVLLATREQAAALIAFFAARKGALESWIVPWAFRPGSDPGNAAAPHSTRVRFDGDSIRLRWHSLDAATASIDVVQLPWEINLPPGEEPVQPAAAHLYRFHAVTPGGALIWRYTDWESDITLGGETHAAAKIEHDRIERGIELDDDGVEITLWLDDQDNPLARILRRTIDVPVHLQISRCDPANTAAGAVVLHSGTVEEVSLDGHKLAASISVLGGALEIKAPAFYFSRTCNHGFCRAGCGLDPAAWTWAAQITAVDGLDLTVTLTSNPQPALALPATFFSRGFISYGDLDDYQLRSIQTCRANGGGSWTISLKRAIRGAIAGGVLSLRPHCSGTVAECKFAGNYINFGGHPHMGGSNLSLPTREQAVAGGKK